MDGSQILDYVETAAKIVGYASFAANFTKTQWDNRALGWATALLNAVALDFKSAKAAAENKKVVVTSKPQGHYNE